jgi:hypothetical protein
MGLLDALLGRTRPPEPNLDVRRTFYPFAPCGPQTRDTVLELQIRQRRPVSYRSRPIWAAGSPLWGSPA